MSLIRNNRSLIQGLPIPFRKSLIQTLIEVYYTQFDPGYVRLPVPWVASGDFEVEIRFRYSSTRIESLLGNSSATVTELRLDPVSFDRLRIIIDSSFYDIANVLTGLTEGEYYTLKVKRESNVATAYIDDVSIGSVTSPGSFEVDTLFQSGGDVRPYDGASYDVSLKDLSTTGNDRFYPLDDISTTIARETVTPDGEELVVNGDFSDGDAGWTFGSDWSISEGKATKVAGVQSSLTQSVSVVSGGAYKVSVVTSDISAGSLWVRLGGFTNQLTISEDGTYTAIVQCESSTSNLVLRSDAAFEGSVTQVSLKETTDAKYIDVQESDKTQELS